MGVGGARTWPIHDGRRHRVMWSACGEIADDRMRVCPDGRDVWPGAMVKRRRFGDSRLWRFDAAAGGRVHGPRVLPCAGLWGPPDCIQAMLSYMFSDCISAELRCLVQVFVIFRVPARTW